MGIFPAVLLCKVAFQPSQQLRRSRLATKHEGEMKLTKDIIHQKRSGTALILSMIFVLIFSALAISMATMSGTNLQLASNQHKVNSALSAAQSALECGKYIVANTLLPSTSINIVTTEQANNAWNTLCSQVQAQPWVAGLASQTGNEIITPSISFGQANTSFQVKFYRSDVNTIKLEGIGSDGEIERYASINMKITKNNEVLQYAIASRGRMWITGDSTIHGDIFSAWNLSTTQLTQLSQLKEQIQQKMNNGTLNSTSFSSLVSSLGLTTSQRTTILNELLNGTLNPSSAASRCISCMSSVPSISPLNVTSDSQVLGTVNTCWSKEQIENKAWQLETLDDEGEPMYDEDGHKIISPEDEIQGYNEGINYGVPPQNMAGMKISDYDTTTYYNMTRTANGGSGDIYYSSSAINYTGNLDSLSSTCGTKYRYEYFPHAVDSYTTNRPGGGGIQVKRYIYKDLTFTDARLLNDKNALFINCTFNGVLYVDCGKTTSNYNNVRFDNCTFNGTIITNTPQTFNWQKNCLYYTGSATFQNNTSAEATILAPHFNVNLGNTNPVSGTENVLRGAIVGGIVDVRGNAEVFGTIISMADTSSYTSGYVTNIGATLDDGGSETVAIGDIGVINITPDSDKMLPSGITTPIVINFLQNTYNECL